jgi:HTH-type transcriptional regulator, competence development regulator
VTETAAQRLGHTLRSVRELKGKSLKAVAEPAEISPAYLLKLEKGEVTSPSPHVLHRLADQLQLPYLDLMRLAGYVVPDAKGASNSALAHALSSEGLTHDEARAVAAFLKVYRSGQESG